MGRSAGVPSQAPDEQSDSGADGAGSSLTLGGKKAPASAGGRRPSPKQERDQGHQPKRQPHLALQLRTQCLRPSSSRLHLLYYRKLQHSRPRHVGPQL